MSYIVLARKWRPKRFAEMVGQEHVLRALEQCARQRQGPSRLPVHRHSRCRQDDGRAHPCEVAQLRNRRQLESLRYLRRLSGDRRGTLRRSHRGRRGIAHQGRRYPRTAGQRAVRADSRPLQGVPHRRSAHAVESFVQRPAENARRAAAARQIPAGDHRPAEAAGHRAVALPAVQPQAPVGEPHRRAPEVHRGGGEARLRAGGARAARARRRRQHARWP